MRRLARILEETDAYIVLSTFWRAFGDYIKYIFGRHGIHEDRIIGSTVGETTSRDARTSAEFNMSERGQRGRSDQIIAWIETHRATVQSFVILDDRPTASDERTVAHFVHTNSATGLSEEDVASAILALQTEPKL